MKRLQIYAIDIDPSPTLPTARKNPRSVEKADVRPCSHEPGTTCYPGIIFYPGAKIVSACYLKR